MRARALRLRVRERRRAADERAGPPPGRARAGKRAGAGLVRGGGRHAAARLQEIAARDGADAIAFLGGEKLVLEEQYLFQKLARAVLGTNHVDSRTRLVAPLPGTAFLKATGGGRPSVSLDELGRTKEVLVLGDDLQGESPFLQAVLGGIPFCKSHLLLGGQMEVRLRTLAPHELDMCWQQSAMDFSAGKLANMMDRVAHALRYQASLQIMSVRVSSEIIDFPERLEDYNVPPQENGDTPLVLIAEHVREQVMQTETRQRMLTQTTMGFNRLVAKLEANAANPDFWEAVADST